LVLRSITVLISSSIFIVLFTNIPKRQDISINEVHTQ
jgi:hypothetical protein